MSISQELYNRIVALDNFTCVYCGVRGPNLEIDHIIPRSVGGPDVLHNLVVACPECNHKKRDYQLYQVKMQLRFGRFAIARARKPLASTPLSTRAKAPEMLQLSKSERHDMIDFLARELGETGVYRHSANTILKMVGGTAADVKKIIADIRTPPKVEPPPEPTQPERGKSLRRPAEGW